MNSSPTDGTPRGAASAAAVSAGASSTELVTVALMGSGRPSRDALIAALTAARSAAVRWHVVDVNLIGRPVSADVVVCASAQVATVAGMCWPDADVIVLVPARDDDSAVLDALEAAVTVCVRGTDVGLIAAYIHAVVRRRREQTRRSSR